MAAADRIIYSIDREDHLISFSSSWTDFALSNDAPELAAEKVQGRSLWEFVADSTTELLYRRLITNVRAGGVANFGLRCDSPGWRRSLEMTMSPAAGEVVFDVRVLKIEPRERQELFDRNAVHSDEFVTVCGWCNKIEAPEGSWAEVEDAVFILDLFWANRPPRLEHSVCDDCLKKMSNFLSRTVFPHASPPGLTSH